MTAHELNTLADQVARAELPRADVAQLQLTFRTHCRNYWPQQTTPRGQR